eukprot:1893374-Heterocapsa_arctica.AAC.1
MITNCVRYHNFWIHVTMYEEDEERGGKIQRLGYRFYRDYGNETYGDFLRITAARAYEKGEITMEEHDEISKFNNANSGNTLEAIMGYAWIFNYKKDPDL